MSEHVISSAQPAGTHRSGVAETQDAAHAVAHIVKLRLPRLRTNRAYQRRKVLLQVVIARP